MIFGRVLGAALLACAIPLAGAAPLSALPEHSRILEPGQVVAAATGPSTRRLLADWQGMLARGEDARLASAWLQRPAAPDLPAWEAATAQMLDALRVAAPREGLDPALAELSAHVPVVWVRHAETASDWFVPAFEIAGSAAALRRSWAVERQARIWSDALGRGGELPMLRLKLAAGDPVEADALRLAIRRTDPAVLRKQAAALQVADVAQAAPGALTELALRTRAPGDYFAALSHEAPASSLDLVSAAPRQLPERDAVAFLERAAASGELASAATLALASMARPGSVALDALMGAIGDPRRGESAAAALAPIDDLRMFDALAARLRSERDPAAQRHLLLYLRLRGDEASRAAAREFAAGPTAAPELALEVQSW